MPVPPVAWKQLAALPFHLAHLVQGALLAEGIDARVDRPTVGPYGLQTGPFAHRLLVPDDQLDEARTLLAEFEAGGRASLEEPEG